MPHANKDAVHDILDPFHTRIRGVVERAWAEWRAHAAWRVEAELQPLLYSRTIANYVFDAIARIAVLEFAADTSVHVQIEPQTIKLFFKGGVCARFKKGDDNKLGQNHPTQASLAFEEADGQLPWFPVETAKVEFIWLANDINTRLEHVLVVARDGDRLLWDYEIENLESSTVVPFPTTSPDGPDGGDLITVKPAEVQKPAENE
jgi:hypothetical protein